MSKKRLFRMVPLKADKQPLDFQGQTVELNVHDPFKRFIIVKTQNPLCGGDVERLRLEIVKSWRGKYAPRILITSAGLRAGNLVILWRSLPRPLQQPVVQVHRAS